MFTMTVGLNGSVKIKKDWNKIALRVVAEIKQV